MGSIFPLMIKHAQKASMNNASLNNYFMPMPAILKLLFLTQYEI